MYKRTITNSITSRHNSINGNSSSRSSSKSDNSSSSSNIDSKSDSSSSSSISISSFTETKPISRYMKSATKYNIKTSKFKTTNVYTPLYNSSWFETERGFTLESYIHHLFQLVKKKLSCNLNKDTTKAILVPHAGIKYSGLCSASAYYELYNRTRKITRIILLCTHHQPPKTLSSINIIGTSYTHITTYKPNGKTKLTIDTKTMQQLSPYIEINDNAFQNEHAFFNQLPFIETIAPNALLCPLLVGNMELTLENNAIIREIMQILIHHAQQEGTVVICTSDLSHINGHFQHKINSHIMQNIRMMDSEILQFLYNIVSGVKTRTSRIDEVLFMQNSPACGIMTMYLFGNLLNAISKRSNYNGGSGKSLLQRGTTILHSRVSCYYTSLQRNKINIFDFNHTSLVSILDNIDSRVSSVSYAGVVFTTQPNIQYRKMRKLDMICSEYEKIALIGLAREQLYYKLQAIKMPTTLIRTIASPVFQLHLGIFTTLYKQGKLRGCIGTLETDNDEYTIESNVKKYILETAFRDNRFTPVDISEFNQLEFTITILYALQPISINEYFGNKFVLGCDGILISHGKHQGYFLPSVATEFSYNKQQLLEQLCTNKMGNNTKECFRSSNAKMFYNEGIELSSNTK